MIDYAEHITAPRPRTRLIDRVLDAISWLTPWLIAAVIGFVFGIAQGAWQSNSYWTGKIIELSTADPSGIALPVYEDVEGNVYYVHREVRP